MMELQTPLLTDTEALALLDPLKVQATGSDLVAAEEAEDSDSEEAKNC